MVGRLAVRARQILFEIAKEYGFLVIAAEIMSDHVHLLIEAPPRYSPTTIVQYFKGISSKKLREEFLPIIEQFIWKEGTLWARGYYIASVADSVTTEVIKEYIDSQKPKEADLKVLANKGPSQERLL
jgi:putative transposase